MESRETGWGTVLENGGFRLYVDLREIVEGEPKLYITDGYGNLMSFSIGLSEVGEATLVKEYTPNGHNKPTEVWSEIMWLLEENHARNVQGRADDIHNKASL